MNTHPTRVWLFSLALLTACAEGASPDIGTDDSSLENREQSPAPAEIQEPGRPIPETKTTELPAPAPSATTNPEETTEPTTPVKKTLNIVWQRQETGYWCGPGSTRIVISTRESVLPSQSSLATQLGTTTNGTDYVGLMVNLLNSRWQLTGTSAAFKQKDLPDPPTTAQRAELKADIVKRINAGYGIVANVWSGWRPTFYPGGEIRHYVAVIGYDENGDKVLVADPAAQGAGGTGWDKVPQTYWITTEELGTWIGGKGYSG